MLLLEKEINHVEETMSTNVEDNVYKEYQSRGFSFINGIDKLGFFDSLQTV